MAISVRYFASLRERMGCNEDRVDFVPGMTVSGLWAVLRGGEESLEEGVLVAVNYDYVKPDQVLSDGDEVAFFPPVTGG